MRRNALEGLLRQARELGQAHGAVIGVSNIHIYAAMRAS